MPVFNSQETIRQSISSVLSQTFSDFEILIVDDASSDHSFELIEELAEADSRIKYFKLQLNSGAAVARNKAIKKARGRFIAFLDSDDRWYPHKLESQIRFMLENDIYFTYSAYDKTDREGHYIDTVGVPVTVNYTQLLKVCSIGCLTAVYDSHSIGKIYMPLIRKRQDFGLWLKILKEVPRAYGLQESLAEYRVDKYSLSGNKYNAAKHTWNMYRNVEKLPLHRAVYYFSHYALNGVLRTKLPRLARFLGVLK
jgi:glycosyltransferase involved in cell wall biosynthesis